MNSFKCLLFFTVLSFHGLAQTVGFRVVEYYPAPGQHINTETTGTPSAAQNITENPENLVSLGSFGGYIILQFTKACVNDPRNPYGVDFTLFGNAFSGSSEPGIVWVMQDTNGNGEPDDIWYEIAGSHHFHSKTVRNYRVTYFRTDTRDVYWESHTGDTGMILANDYHTQDYYPDPSLFNEYPRDSVSFEGTLLFSALSGTDQQEIKTEPFAFGYADNHSLVRSVDPAIPDNPYTTETEGAGGDAIDISWAVDAKGEYVELDSVHFVKVVSGNLTHAGWLGELSTDLSWLADVDPAGSEVYKKNRLVVFEHFGKLIAGDSLLLEAAFFEEGRMIETPFSFFSEDPSVAIAEPGGKITAVSPGEAEIRVSANGETEQFRITVVVPDSLQVTPANPVLYPGDTVYLNVTVFDNIDEKLDVPLLFSLSDESVGEITGAGEKIMFRALQPGETRLTCRVEGYSLEKTIPVRVLSEDDKMKICFSMKWEEENLLPFQWIEVGPAGLNEVVDDRQQDYSGMDRITLFHALVTGLNKSGLEYAFRDDTHAGGRLYLHSVMKDGINIRGWGGKTDPPAYAQGWIARKNDDQIISAFDQTDVFPGDTIDLYHVPDLLAPWIYSRLLSNKDSADTGEEVELFLEQVPCSLTVDGVTEGDFSPGVDLEVVGDQSYFTDENGVVRVTLSNGLPAVYTFENSAVLIAQKTVTGLFFSRLPEFSLSPNPARDRLMISGRNLAGAQICIRDMYSRQVAQFHPQSDVTVLNISFLAPGLYYLTVLTVDQSETLKFIRQ